MLVSKQKEPLFPISYTESQIRTSYNQQEAGTNERGAKRAAVQQQVDLLASWPRQAPRFDSCSAVEIWLAALDKGHIAMQAP